MLYKKNINNWLCFCIIDPFQQKAKREEASPGMYLDNNNCAPSFLRSLCENRRWLFWAKVFFRGSAAPEEKYRGPKQSPTNSHNWPKQRWCKVIIVINNCYFDNFVCFMCIFWQKHKENSIFCHFCIHPCKPISIRPDVTIIAQCDKCVNTGCVARDYCLCVYAYARMALCQRHTQKSLSKVFVTW